MEILKTNCQLGESPIYDQNNFCVYWLDVDLGHVHKYNLRKNDMIFSINEENIVYMSFMKESRPILTNEEKIYDISVKDNHNFIIATKIHTTNQQQYIDGPIVSNCHHISSEVSNKT